MNKNHMNSQRLRQHSEGLHCLHHVLVTDLINQFSVVESVNEWVSDSGPSLELFVLCLFVLFDFNVIVLFYYIFYFIILKKNE